MENDDPIYNTTKEDDERDMEIPETEEEYNLRLKKGQDAHDNRFFDLSKADPDDLSDIAESQSGSRTMYN